MHDIEVKAGKTFRYDLWFSGEPEPDVTWERDGVGLAGDDSGRISIENFIKRGETSQALLWSDDIVRRSLLREEQRADGGEGRQEGGLRDLQDQVDVHGRQQ